MPSYYYWDAVLQEVLHKDVENYDFLFTNIRGEVDTEKRDAASRVIHARYYLGHPFPEVYFTERELQCASGLINGQTVSKIATDLTLSPRTVEYYLKNIKVKLSSRTRAELVCRLMTCEGLQQYIQQPARENKES